MNAAGRTRRIQAVVLAMLACIVCMAASRPAHSERPPWGGVVDCLPEEGFPAPDGQLFTQYHLCGHFDLAAVDAAFDHSKVAMGAATLGKDVALAAIIADSSERQSHLFMYSAAGRFPAVMLVGRGYWPTEEVHDCRIERTGECSFNRGDGGDGDAEGDGLLRVLVLGNRTTATLNAYWSP